MLLELLYQAHNAVYILHYEHSSQVKINDKNTTFIEKCGIFVVNNWNMILERRL